MNPIKNIQLKGVSKDSGWLKYHEGRCVTDWVRRIKTDRPATEIQKELLEAKDFPGWTGVQRAPGLDKDGEITFTSTWDSGD